MKIIKLTMNAFSTYHQKTVVDFDEMIDHGIYLISGPTGSGKTTIFDAITFALYGSASGSERSQNHFRSDFASSHEETYVELEFELHSKIYTVKRSPTYTRLGYKTPKMANAYLTFDGVTIEGVKEVNAKINELIGVDVHQFKQIVMIAQGEFTKLIYANSEEREKVLRHIFHSEPLVKFEDILKEKTKSYKEQYTLSLNKLISQFQLLSLPEEFFIAHKDGFHPSYIDDASKENEMLNEQYIALSKQYQFIKDEYNLLNNEYNQLEKQNHNITDYKQIYLRYILLQNKREEMEQCLYDIEKMKSIQNHSAMIYKYERLSDDIREDDKQYQSYLIQKEDVERQYKDIHKEYLGLSSLQTIKEQYLLDIHNLEDKIRQKEDYVKKTKELHKHQEEYNQLSSLYEKQKEDNENLNKRIERDRQNVDQLPFLTMELERMETLVANINQRKVSIHELSDLYDQSENIQDQHYSLSEIYKKKDEEYQILFHRYLKEDENFKRQQAGILALTLKENEPCPVCGSLHHPHIASITQDVLSSIELEVLSQEVEKAKQAKEEAYQDVLIQNQRYTDMKNKIDFYKKQLDIEEELSKQVFIRLLSNIIQITDEQKKKYNKINTEISYLKKVKKSLDMSVVDYNKQMKQLEELKTKNREKEMMISNMKTVIDSLNIKDEDMNYKELLVQKKKDLQSLDKKITDIQNQYNDSSKKLALFNQTIETLHNKLTQLKQEYQSVSQLFNEFILTHFKDEQEYGFYSRQLKTLNDKEKIYSQYQLDINTVKNRLEELNEYKDLEVKDLTKHKENISLKEETMNSVYKNMNEVHLLYNKNHSLIENLKNVYQANQKILYDYTLYQDLADYASGKNAQRLSFERYVLSSYFEHILEFANIELLKMSAGRFALYRKKETKGNRQQGLDLSVLDYETGMMRDIQSLSGGESFKAALSLALGLSSMIQSYAGGIELNTLFIDEGFGSLDSESIDKALKVLLDLKNDNKVIGIISHVSDLKERINTQIIVEKGKNGSYLHIEKD